MKTILQVKRLRNTGTDTLIGKNKLMNFLIQIGFGLSLSSDDVLGGGDLLIILEYLVYFMN